jgi:hypothetical protein
MPQKYRTNYIKIAAPLNYSGNSDDPKGVSGAVGLSHEEQYSLACASPITSHSPGFPSEVPPFAERHTVRRLFDGICPHAHKQLNTV